MNIEEWLNILNSDSLTFSVGLPVPMRAGQYCRPHMHTNVEIVYHAEGGSGLTCMNDGTEIAFTNESIVIYPARKPHDQRMNTGGVDYCVLISFPEEMVSIIDRVCYIPGLPDTSFKYDMISLAKRNTPATILQKCACNHRVISILATLVPFLTRETSYTTNPQQDMSKVAAIIQRDYHLPVRMDSLSDEVCMSESYMRHQFSKQYGMSPGSWLREVRLNRAKELLQHTVLSQKEIARLCGFNTERYFSRIFHKYTGQTPGQFRKRLFISE